MVRNGVTVIHLATGFLVGSPPGPSIDHFVRFMQERYKVAVVVGTHSTPAKYLAIHERLGTWKAPERKFRRQRRVRHEGNPGFVRRPPVPAQGRRDSPLSTGHGVGRRERIAIY
jgi:hypothetical protein